ncbi:MAG: hypothetical protein ABIH56_05025, partial [Candidatus Margulisiibacteriota bacterium]
MNRALMIIAYVSGDNFRLKYHIVKQFNGARYWDLPMSASPNRDPDDSITSISIMTVGRTSDHQSIIETLLLEW